MAMMNEMEYRTIGKALAGGYRAAVYCRLSKDDDLQGESASIANQDKICQGVFLQKLQIVQRNMSTSHLEQFSYLKTALNLALLI